MPRSYANQLLLHIPTNDGTYFDGTLTYVCFHSQEGALGLVINRPLNADLNLLLEANGLEHYLDQAPRVFEGGPVDAGVPSILHSDDVLVKSSLALAPTSGTVITPPTDKEALVELLDHIANNEGPRKFLVALGYAGWHEGQLDSEMNNNCWITCPGSAELIFDAPVEERAHLAAASIGIDLDLLVGSPNSSA